jgi:hypothetical protein
MNPSPMTHFRKFRPLIIGFDNAGPSLSGSQSPCAHIIAKTPCLTAINAGMAI